MTFIRPDPGSQIHTRSNEETHDLLCTLLQKEKKVFYTRFGDGDIYILMGLNQANHRFSNKLSTELLQSLSINDPLYLKGMVVDYPIEKKMTKGLFLTFKSNDEMREHLVKTFPDDLPLGYVNSWFPAYYTAFRPRDMSAFLDRFVRPKKKMFIGSVPKDEVEQLFGYIDYYISTPRKNAFAEIDNWWQEVEKHIDEVELVLPAVGISTRVITKRLWEQGSEIHCLDLGSIVDAISSYPNTRSWIRLKGHVASRILLPEYRNNSARYWIRYGLKEIYLFFRSLFYRIDPFASLPFFPKARVYHPGPRKTYR